MNRKHPHRVCLATILMCIVIKAWMPQHCVPSEITPVYAGRLPVEFTEFPPFAIKPQRMGHPTSGKGGPPAREL